MSQPTYDPDFEQAKLAAILTDAGYQDVAAEAMFDRELQCFVVRGTFRIGDHAAGAFFVGPTAPVTLFAVPGSIT